MSTDGKPEHSTQQFGRAVARLRTKRDWSRAKLANKLRDRLDSSDPLYESIGESFLARLENGRMVKVPRSIIEGLCRALECTPQEEAHLLLHADRSPVGHTSEEPSEVAEMVNFVMMQTYREAENILKALLHERRARELTENEMFVIVSTALELVISSRLG